VTKQALVVVDMQEYFCQPGHALARFISALGQPGAADWYWGWLEETVVPLAGTDIAARLAKAGIETVVVAGVVTDVCVTGMARELADADFSVFVVADACGAPMRESHEWALRVAIPTFAAITTTDDVMATAMAVAEQRTDP
jgi:nicotinamidase-related amidase